MNGSTPQTAPSPSHALLVLRLIGASLGFGVTVFALVAWSVHERGSTLEPPGDPMLTFNIVLGLALASVIAAILLWRARVAPLIGRTATDEDAAARVGRIQGGVIIVWALIEGAALLAVVVHFLHDMPLAGAMGVVLIWGALAATWPKREWLGVDA